MPLKDVLKAVSIPAAILLATIAVLPATNAYDRWYAGRRAAVGWGVGYGMAGFAANNGYGVGTAYSAGENARANTIRAQGEYNQMSAAAMVDYESARSVYLDNQAKWTQIYIERQKAAAELKAQKEQEMQARAERAKAFNAQHPPTGPARLSSSQFDPSTGKITWPLALTAPTFSDTRNSVDKQFELRQHTGTNAAIVSTVEKAVNDMRNTLRNKIREIPSQDYMEARRFLDSVVVEVRSEVS